MVGGNNTSYGFHNAKVAANAAYTYTSAKASSSVSNATLQRQIQRLQKQRRQRERTWIKMKQIFWKYRRVRQCVIMITMLIMLSFGAIIRYSINTIVTPDKNKTTVIKNKKKSSIITNNKNHINHISPSIIAKQTTTSASATAATIASALIIQNNNNNNNQLTQQQPMRSKSTEQQVISSTTNANSNINNRITATSSTTTTTTTTMPQNLTTTNQQLQLQHQIVVIADDGDDKEGKNNLDNNTDYDSNIRRMKSTADTSIEEQKPQWLQDYIEFHTNSIQQKTSLRKTKVTYELTNNVRYIQYICIDNNNCGGLGDRINGIIQTFYMSICTNSIFLIRPFKEEEREKTFFLQPNNNIHWDIENPIINNNNDIIRIDAMDDRYNNQYLIEPLNLFNNNKNDTNIEIRTNLWMGQTFLNSKCWKNYIQKYNNDDNDNNITPQYYYKLAFDTIFQWSNDVIDYSYQLLQQKVGLSYNEPYIAMHIRTGLLSTSSSHADPLRHSDPKQWDMFVQCADKLAKQLVLEKCFIDNNNKKVNVYLASDHQSVKDYLIKNSTSVDKATTNLQLKTIMDLNIVHLDHINNNNNNNDNNDNNNDILSVWSELYVLSKSICIIKSHSKYSQVASEISSYNNVCSIYYDECDDNIIQQAILRTSQQSCQKKQQEKTLIIIER